MATGLSAELDEHLDGLCSDLRDVVDRVGDGGAPFNALYATMLRLGEELPDLMAMTGGASAELVRDHGPAVVRHMARVCEQALVAHHEARDVEYGPSEEEAADRSALAGNTCDDREYVQALPMVRLLERLARASTVPINIRGKTGAGGDQLCVMSILPHVMLWCGCVNTFSDDGLVLSHEPVNMGTTAHLPLASLLRANLEVSALSGSTMHRHGDPQLNNVCMAPRARAIHICSTGLTYVLELPALGSQAVAFPLTPVVRSVGSASDRLAAAATVAHRNAGAAYPPASPHETSTDRAPRKRTYSTASDTAECALPASSPCSTNGRAAAAAVCAGGAAWDAASGASLSDGAPCTPQRARARTVSHSEGGSRASSVLTTATTGAGANNSSMGTLSCHDYRVAEVARDTPWLLMNVVRMALVLFDTAGLRRINGLVFFAVRAAPCEPPAPSEHVDAPTVFSMVRATTQSLAFTAANSTKGRTTATEMSAFARDVASVLYRNFGFDPDPRLVGVNTVFMLLRRTHTLLADHGADAVRRLLTTVMILGGDSGRRADSDSDCSGDDDDNDDAAAAANIHDFGTHTSHPAGFTACGLHMGSRAEVPPLYSLYCKRMNELTLGTTGVLTRLLEVTRDWLAETHKASPPGTSLRSAEAYVVTLVVYGAVRPRRASDYPQYLRGLTWHEWNVILVRATELGAPIAYDSRRAGIHDGGASIHVVARTYMFAVWNCITHHCGSNLARCHRHWNRMLYGE